MLLDIFNSDAFSLIELTEAINILPYKPGRLGESGLFKVGSLSQFTAAIEYENGTLSLVQTAQRGTMPRYSTKKGRKVRHFEVPHLPINGAVMATDVSGIREFGEEQQLEILSDKVNDILEDHRQSLEVTVEYHRIGALKGLILDADGSTIFDLFDEFDITQTPVTFFGATSTKLLLNQISREIEAQLGAMPLDRIECICGKDWFDALISDDEVKAAYDKYQDGQMLRESNRKAPFVYADVAFSEYRGQVGSVPFIDDDQAHFYPVGVPNLFVEKYAPANFMETVNTPGKPVYSKIQNMDFDVGVEVHSQSNPFVFCTRPSLLMKGVK